MLFNWLIKFILSKVGRYTCITLNITMGVITCIVYSYVWVFIRLEKKTN